MLLIYLVTIGSLEPGVTSADRSGKAHLHGYNCHYMYYLLRIATLWPWAGLVGSQFSNGNRQDSVIVLGGVPPKFFILRILTELVYYLLN